MVNVPPVFTTNKQESKHQHAFPSFLIFTKSIIASKEGYLVTENIPISTDLCTTCMLIKISVITEASHLLYKKKAAQSSH